VLGSARGGEFKTVAQRPIKEKQAMALDGISVFLYSIQTFKGDSPMAIARCQQIDICVARWYHCMSRCVRRPLLQTEGAFYRKEWLEDRVEELVEG